MRRSVLLLSLLSAGCPSLDGFAGKNTQAEAGPSGESYLSLEDAARFCSNVFKCEHLADSTRASLLVPVDTTSYSTCVDWFAGPLPPGRTGVTQQAKALTCAAKATTCEAAAACMLMEFIGPNDPRCAPADAGATGDAGTAGDAGAFVGCSADGKSVYRCNYSNVLHCDNPYYGPGSTCQPSGTGEFWCAAPGACPASAACKAGTLTYCGSSNLSFAIDCAVLGQTCGLDPSSGLTECLADGVLPECTTTGLSCVGNRVRMCWGSYSEYDCAQLGGTCASTPAPHCVRPTDECSSADPDINVCAGDAITLCVAGKRTPLDCASIGKKCASPFGTARCD